jgi:CRP/FNR family transcriptional regulator, nitrogen oxide reductase regulator
VAPPLDRSLVSSFAIFAGVPDEDIDAVLALARPRRLAENAVAFQQGDPAGEFFLLLHGRLKVQQTTPDGQQVVVRYIDPGDLFGIAHAVRRPDYPGTAIAMVESLALVWPEGQWNAFIGRNPAFAMGAMQTVGARLQDANARIRELSTEAVERRIAHAILRLVNQAGRKTPEGIEIDFPVTRADIAEMAGTTLHTVSRMMSGWQQQGLVTLGRRRVTVTDPHRLFILAEGNPDRGNEPGSSGQHG